MTQSSNHSKYELYRKEFDFNYKVFQSRFYLALDAENRFFRIFFNSDQEHLKPYLNSIGLFLLDKKIDDIDGVLARVFYSEKNSLLEESFYWDQSLLIYQNLIKQVKGLETSRIESPRTLICPCEEVDEKYLNSLFESEKGQKKRIIQKLNIGMTCGECLNLFDKCFTELSEKSSFVAGYTLEELYDQLDKELSEFPDYTEFTLSAEDIKIEKIDFPFLKIKMSHLKNKDDSLKLKNQVINFLFSRLNLSFEVELTIE
jgi:bacterioferritin-associated ferredoxin